ncbi:MAG: tetratricopeptide repeat protein [Actinomycetota bacterium]
MNQRLSGLLGLLALALAVGAARYFFTPRAGPGAAAAREAARLSEMGSHSHTLPYWKQAVLQEPGNGDYYGELGNAYLALGKTDLAASALQMAAHFQPERPHVFCQLAQSLVEERRRDEALGAIETALKMTPECPLALSVRGEQALRDDNLKDALPAFERVLQIQPNNRLAYQKVGYILLSTQRYEEARQILERGLTRDPGDPGLHALLGEVFSQMSQDARSQRQAEQHFLKALVNNPEEAKVRADLGKLYLRMNRVNDAEIQYGRAQALRPFMGDALYGMAQVSRRQGRSAQAEGYLRILRRGQQLERTVRGLQARAMSDPSNVPLRLRIARICLDNGLLKEARRTLDEAIALAPDNREAREARSRWFSLSGMSDRASWEAAIASRLPEPTP